MYSNTDFKKSALRSAVLLALGLNGVALTLSDGTALASKQSCASSSLSTDRANFTMLTSGGKLVGGTNDATMSWDGTAFTSSSDYTGPGSTTNVTMSSTTPFFSYKWTAHDIQVFAPGSYSFDTALGGGNPESGILNVTVPAGDVGVHMLFNWNGNNNIDVFVVAKPSSVFGAGVGQTHTGAPCIASGTKNCLWTGPGYAGGNAANAPTGAHVWMLASVDGDGNGVMGIPMATGGPFASFNANFNFSFSSAFSYQSGTVCSAPVPTLTPSTFTAVTGAPVNTLETSNSITVSGLGSFTANVSVSGGKYSKNGGAYTNVDGTAVDGDTFTVQQTSSPNADGTTTTTNLNINGAVAAYNVTTIDKKPDTFTFTPVNGATAGNTYESNAITVSGMDSGQTAPISIVSSNNTGMYAVSTDNGVTWSAYSTTTPATVQNGNQVKVKVTADATATKTTATLTLGSTGGVDGSTNVSGEFDVNTSLSSSGNNFTMLDSGGHITGGTNDVVMVWDGQTNSAISDPITPTNAHMQLSSVTPFFQHNWTAHHIGVYGPGTYIVNVDCTVNQWETGTCTPNSNTARNYTFTVGANQVAAHMLFDWNGTTNIDVLDIWDINAVFSPSPLYTGAGGFNSATTTWHFMSSDAAASCPGAVSGSGALINCGTNGINGIPMIDGPFRGFSANFNLQLAGTTSAGNYTPTVKVQDPSNSPGCSISQSPVSAVKQADWWLVGGFLAWLGAIRLRLKCRQAKS